jgi:signal transduction histidine kinase
MDDKTRVAAIAAELPAVHAATALFPLLAPDELCALAADIAAHGLRFPIVRHDGAILDGRNRWMACRLADVEPTFTEYTNSGSPTAYVVSMNLKRRDLTVGQRAVLAVELEKMLGEEGKARMRKGGQIAGRGRKGRERIPYPVGKAVDQAGSLLHVSGRYVSAAKKLVAEAPEAADLVREGRVTLPDAKQLIDVSTAQRRAVIVKIRNGEAKTVRAALPASRGRWQLTRAIADLHALLDGAYRQWPSREWRVFAHELHEHVLRIEKRGQTQIAETIPSIASPSADGQIGDRGRGGPEGGCVVEDITEHRRAAIEREELLAIAEPTKDSVERWQAATDVALAHHSLAEALAELLARIQRMLAVDTVVILLLDDRAGSLRPRAAVGLDQARACEVAIPVGKGFAGRVADECRPLMLEAVAPTDVLNPVLLETGVRSLFGVPVLDHGRVLGVLHVGTREPRRFSDDDSHLLQLAADCLALAFGRDRLYAAEREARATAEANLRARAEAERLKDDLSNMVVHDLKNPVTSIAMLAQLALRKGLDLPATQRNSLLQVERTCREMMGLIQNLLEISELEEGKMRVSRGPIVLAEIVHEIVVEYGPVAEQTGHRLVATVGLELPCVVADRALLKRVLVNLVMNALRHSGSTEVRVEATHDPATARVRLRVIDHGRGIAEGDQERVFEKFALVRRSRDSEPSSDTGLGLPFCKLATDCMGGKIALSSRPETGTVFTIILPSQ